MTCQELIAFLMEYLGDELSAQERTCFEAHLGCCPDCVAYLDAYKKTIALGRAAVCGERSALPAHVPEDLVRAILAARPVRGDSPSA